LHRVRGEYDSTPYPPAFNQPDLGLPDGWPILPMTSHVLICPPHEGIFFARLAPFVVRKKYQAA